MIIDIFAHHIPKSVRPFIGKAGFYEQGDNPESPPQNEINIVHYSPQNTNPEARLELMDKYHIDIQALSQTTPVLLQSSPAEAAEICRLSNDDNYTLCKLYPGRFINICTLSLLDMKTADQELERSINELDCRGVTISSNQDGKGLDSPEYFPFYQKLVKHDLPLLIQPTDWESYSLVSPQKGIGAMVAIGWPFDTTQAVYRMIVGGVIDEFPSLKIIMHHCGAMLPFFVNRIEITLRKVLKTDPAKYWKNIYGDTAVAGSLPAHICGYAFFGADRMMFGSDYPFGGETRVKEGLACIKNMGIPESESQKILGGTAARLFKVK
jgi:predicted TIM-barrel fold metal-dependent hydrolase